VAKTLEGEARGVHVVLKFASIQRRIRPPVWRRRLCHQRSN